MTEFKSERGISPVEPGGVAAEPAPARDAGTAVREETGAQHLARMRQIRRRRQVYAPRPDGRIS